MKLTGHDGWMDRTGKRFFYDDGLLFMAYVWAGSFFLGSLVQGDPNWFVGMVFFAQNLSASLCNLKRKDHS